MSCRSSLLMPDDELSSVRGSSSVVAFVTVTSHRPFGQLILPMLTRLALQYELMMASTASFVESPASSTTISLVGTGVVPTEGLFASGRFESPGRLSAFVLCAGLEFPRLLTARTCTIPRGTMACRSMKASTDTVDISANHPRSTQTSISSNRESRTRLLCRFLFAPTRELHSYLALFSTIVCE